jgi:hypothetical protein
MARGYAVTPAVGAPVIIASTSMGITRSLLLPGPYKAMYAQSKKLMKRPAVHLAKDIRTVVLDEFVWRLQTVDLDVVVAALDDRHLHILARFPERNPRHFLGLAKKHTSHVLREMQIGISDGGIWSKRSK